MNSKNKAAFYTLVSAFLYAISIPFSKILLEQNIPPVMLASFTYLGAGFGLLGFGFLKKILFTKSVFENPLTKKELPYTFLMVILDIFAICFLMSGLSMTSSANASLLSNFEIAATSLIALFVFREKISKKLWSAIVLIIIASIILTFEGKSSFDFTIGSLFVLAAYICWGAENNCTKMISGKNTFEITIIKGCFSGAISLIAAFFLKENLPSIKQILIVMSLGFVSYGMSVVFYILAQRFQGAAKTAAYFSSAPYMGVVLSLVLLSERPEINFYIALTIMIAAAFFVFADGQKYNV